MFIHFRFITRLPFPVLLGIFLLFSLSDCGSKNDTTTEVEKTGIVLPPPPPSVESSRPSPPVPRPAQTQQQPIDNDIFAPNPEMETILNTMVSSSVFPFQFEQPGEMAPPREITFSGSLNTTLDTLDFPAFALHLWSNRQQDTEPTAGFELSFEKETANTYSFQITTPEAVPAGLYYYLVVDEAKSIYYANKVIVDY